MPALPSRLSPYGHERDLSGSLVTPSLAFAVLQDPGRTGRPRR